MATSKRCVKRFSLIFKCLTKFHLKLWTVRYSDFKVRGILFANWSEWLKKVTGDCKCGKLLNVWPSTELIKDSVENASYNANNDIWYTICSEKKVNYAINLLIYAKLIRLHVLSLLLLKISRQKSNFCDVFAYPIKMIFACSRKERHQTNNLPFRFGYQTIHSQSYCRFHILLL